MQRTDLLVRKTSSGVRCVLKRTEGVLSSLFVLPSILVTSALAQIRPEATGSDVKFGARKTFLMLFLMLEPIELQT